ncbi:hypothetical protein BLOT_005138 [Blomia tropicalis]|nr:hypothetical protein BLOT_005138 [Blomia tropicalis]
MPQAKSNVWMKTMGSIKSEYESSHLNRHHSRESINIIEMFEYRYPTPANKPFHMSYRRLLTLIFLCITLVNISSMLFYTIMHLQRINIKEEREKFDLTSQYSSYYPLTNKDAYSVVRFIHFIALIVGISVRFFGLIAIGFCGKEFSDIEYESSDKRESFTGSLSYTCSMIVLLAAYYVGIVRLTIFDLICHYLLTIIGAIFVGFALQPRENYSKELNTLPI